MVQIPVSVGKIVIEEMVKRPISAQTIAQILSVLFDEEVVAEKEIDEEGDDYFVLEVDEITSSIPAAAFNTMVYLSEQLKKKQAEK